MKSPNLRHRQARSQNKGLSRASRLYQTIPRWKQAGDGSQSQKGTTVAPERHPVPNCKETSWLTKTSWDSGHSTSARRVAAPQKRQTAHLRSPTHCTPRKPSDWDREGDKLQPSTGGDYTCQAPGRLSCWDLGQAQNAGPTKWSNREP